MLAKKFDFSLLFCSASSFAAISSDSYFLRSLTSLTIAIICSSPKYFPLFNATSTGKISPDFFFP
ncbi:MAG TPA: hypothetical protein P5538_08250 [Bacteroidales bacterium]|jgi:hypothetical protein|nr:hypothetical protein [Bacteroidales bacterium]HOL98803.1 hypothetical protein [Bacteroidales bacterium]HOM37035.1 hypothetical protein [Bacteroidales bacterium]HPD24660.1 hypothetical protein [Bacteroidales bacterium]HRT00405.1 hypothetical protein [Bacteroidales bacterium]